MLTHNGPQFLAQFSPQLPLSKSGAYTHMNWSACQFPRSDKRNHSWTWRSANSTRSVVAAAWHWQRAHIKFQLPHWPTWRSRHRCDSQLLSPSLPPFAQESNRKRLYDHMCRHRSRDLRMRTFPWKRPWTHTDAFRDTSASAHCCAYLLVFVKASVDNADVSANARRRVRERVCKLIPSAASTADVNATLH